MEKKKTTSNASTKAKKSVKTTAKKVATSKSASTKKISDANKNFGEKKGPIVSPRKLNFKKPDFSNLKGNKFLKIMLWVIIFVISFGIIDFVFQYVNNDMSIAMVNGERISRKEYYRELHLAAGSQISEKLIEDAIIRQEAKKTGITVAQEDIDQVIDDYIAYVGGEEVFNQLMEQQGTSREEIEKSLETTFMLKEMVIENINPTDEELETFFNDYKDSYFPGEETTFEDNKEEVREMYLEQQYMVYKDSRLAELKANAIIQNNYSDKPDYGIFKLTTNIFKSILKISENEADSESLAE